MAASQHQREDLRKKWDPWESEFRILHGGVLPSTTPAVRREIWTPGDLIGPDTADNKKSEAGEMIPPQKKSLALMLGCLALTTSAFAGNENSRRPGAMEDFNSTRGNAIAGLKGSGSGGWSNGLVIEPGRLRLTAQQFQNIERALDRTQTALRSYYAAPPSSPLRQLTITQWWNQLPAADKSELGQYGVTAQNVESTSLAPYFTYASSSAASDPKQLYVVDQDFFSQAQVTHYKNKDVTRYRTEYYSYPVWVNAGRCGCHSYIAYWATGSYQVAYTDTIQVPAAYTLAVEAVTPNKIAEDHSRNVTVRVPYSEWEPVYARGGRCGCHVSLAYWREITRYRDEQRTVTTLELKDQVPNHDDAGRANLFARDGATPDSENNIVFETNDDGDIVFQSAAAAADGHSGDLAEVVSNPAHPRPH